MQSIQRALGCWFLAAGLAVGVSSGAVAAQEAIPWESPDAWLCLPGRQDLCSAPVVRGNLDAEGRITRDEVRPDPAAPVDCFYVYPTISMDPNSNSSLVPGPGERRAVESQFAMYASVCRPFAPMYRQVTLAGLRAALTGTGTADPALAYGDVVAAWKYYLANFNKGRGVVLVGHSQGSRMLLQLLQREIEGTPIQRQLVSALLGGFNIEVAQGSDRGGSLKAIPLCATKTQTGCVVAFASFRASSPPPENTRFARSRTPGMDVGCVDPVALSGVPASSYLSVKSNLLGGPLAQADWVNATSLGGATFVNLPGLISTRCVHAGTANYLEVSMSPSASGKQPKDIPGDIVVGGRTWDDWGLHLVDMNLATGNLLELVRAQSLSFLARSKP